MISVLWLSGGCWHDRAFPVTHDGAAAALTFVESCGEDDAVSQVYVATTFDEPVFWRAVDEAMGFVGRFP